MKALELTVYPKRGRETYVLPHPQWSLGAVAVDRRSQAKRLNDAELAAEMHAANSDAWRAHSAKGAALPLLEDRFRTLARFATLPHYDEAVTA